MPEAIRETTGTVVAFGDVVQLSKERSPDPEADGFDDDDIANSFACKRIILCRKVRCATEWHSKHHRVQAKLAMDITRRARKRLSDKSQASAHSTSLC